MRVIANAVGRLIPPFTITGVSVYLSASTEIGKVSAFTSATPVMESMHERERERECVYV